MSYEYDNADRLVKETQSSSAGNHVIAYEYDTLDRRIRRTVNGTDATTYTWDKASRLTSIGYAGQTTSYAYDATGRLVTKTLPNGIMQTHGYDKASRLISITYAQPDATVIETISYTYDANGRRTSKTSASNSTAQETGFTATYDDADRMTAVTLKGTGAGGTDESCTLAYDNNGNLATKTCGANVTTYTWDAQNRLTGISGPGTTASFGYDALGPAHDTHGERHHDDLCVRRGAGDCRDQGRHQRDFAHRTCHRRGDRALQRLGQPNDAHRCAGQRDRGGEGRQDDCHTQGVHAVWAEHQHRRGECQRQSVHGRENDGTGLIYYRARYRDPVLGWISEDPIGLAGGINQRAFVGGNPVSYIDPYGLWAWGDPVPQSVVDFSAGMGDVILFGQGQLIRDLLDIGGVDRCSSAYDAGEWAGIAASFATGAVGGLKAAGTKGAGREFSHWIPNRMGGPRSIWNGNFVSTEVHALSDPFRYRFMPRTWKAANPMPSRVNQQWVRMPNVYKGAGAGGAYGAGGAAMNDCTCSR